MAERLYDMTYEKEKSIFSEELKKFASALAGQIALNDEWTI